MHDSSAIKVYSVYVCFVCMNPVNQECGLKITRIWRHLRQVQELSILSPTIVLLLSLFSPEELVLYTDLSIRS